MLLMIDNYDSFTYNLVQYLMVLGEEVCVRRNDAVSLSEIDRMAPEAVILSPGPGTPDDAGICVEAVRHCSGTVPVLGICLGHQCIGVSFGGSVVNARRIMHGKVSRIEHDGTGVFAGMRSPVSAIRYHSLAVAEAGLSSDLEVTARSEDGEIMGLKHREHLTVGVQFHPESVMTPGGKRMLANFLKETRERRNGA